MNQDAYMKAQQGQQFQISDTQPQLQSNSNYRRPPVQHEHPLRTSTTLDSDISKVEDNDPTKDNQMSLLKEKLDRRIQETLDRKRVMQRDLMRLIQRFDQLKGVWVDEKAHYFDEEERLIRAGSHEILNESMKDLQDWFKERKDQAQLRFDLCRHALDREMECAQDFARRGLMWERRMMRERLMARFYGDKVQLKQEWEQLVRLRTQAVLNHGLSHHDNGMETANGQVTKKQKLMDAPNDAEDQDTIVNNNTATNPSSETLIREYQAILKQEMEETWQQQQRHEDPYLVYPDTCHVWSVLPAGISRLGGEDVRRDLERMGKVRREERQADGNSHGAGNSVGSGGGQPTAVDAA